MFLPEGSIVFHGEVYRDYRDWWTANSAALWNRPIGEKTSSTRPRGWRSNTRVAIRVFDLIEQSAGIRIEWIGTSRLDFTKAFFRKHADHQFSFAEPSVVRTNGQLGATFVAALVYARV
jgi:hypothetical protein